MFVVLNFWFGWCAFFFRIFSGHFLRFSFHPFHRFFGYRFYGIHQPDNFLIADIHGLQNGANPGIIFTANVDKHIGILDFDNISRRGIVGMNFGGRLYQHRQLGLIPGNGSGKIIDRKNGRDNADFSRVIGVFSRRIWGTAGYAQRQNQQHY